MAGSSARFRVNAKDVVHETIDGEVIAIDLARGSYYNLAGGAVPVWQMLVHGAAIDDIVQAFAAGNGDTDEIRSSVEELLARLSAESLVVAEEGEAGTAPARPGASPAEFTSFRFEKYDDMQDYFLLDPIHEVDAAGWPKPQPG